jgi:hypothetical protein
MGRENEGLLLSASQGQMSGVYIYQKSDSQCEYLISPDKECARNLRNKQDNEQAPAGDKTCAARMKDLIWPKVRPCFRMRAGPFRVHTPYSPYISQGVQILTVLSQVRIESFCGVCSSGCVLNVLFWA